MAEQFSLFSALSFSVSDVTRYVRTLLESDEFLSDLWVRGEISNLARPRSGHVYFTLKDENSALRCVVWRNNALRLPLALQDGLAVEAHGGVGIYERDGQYQLYVDFVRPAGEGLLFQEFQRLKQKLEAEGLFDEDRKRPIPSRPRIIAIVTSSTAAALQDVLNTLQGRNPLLQVYLSPTSVQGDAAPPEIVRAIRRANETVSPDVILLVRGGGSLEDLWAFNDERVVRAVAASQAPVISGVGHETDFTLSDFAADLRAPTPTGAAVLAAPDRTELLGDLRDRERRLEAVMADRLDDAFQETRTLALRLGALSPRWRVQNGRQRVDDLNERLYAAGRRMLSARRINLQSQQSRLVSLSPLAVLQRGYALVSKDGKIVRSHRQVQTGERVDVRLAEGRLHVTVERSEGEEISP